MAYSNPQNTHKFVLRMSLRLISIFLLLINITNSTFPLFPSPLPIVHPFFVPSSLLFLSSFPLFSYILFLPLFFPTPFSFNTSHPSRHFFPFLHRLGLLLPSPFFRLCTSPPLLTPQPTPPIGVPPPLQSWYY